MRLDRRSLMAGTALLAAYGHSRATAATPAREWARTSSLDPSETIQLWPGGAPGNLDPQRRERIVERGGDPEFRDRAISGITAARVLVFRPQRHNGGAIVIIPGGGYRHIVIDKEGLETAQLATEQGLTAFVLFHRLPAEGWTEPADVAWRDAQQAMRLVRRNAARFRIDPDRIAMIGFSAGGHIAAEATLREPAPASIPTCTALIYPVVSMQAPIAHEGSRALLLGDAPSAETEIAHSPNRNVSADAPPFFLLHAEDDRAVSAQNTVVMRDALKAQDVSVETHLLATGGHGFGMRAPLGEDAPLWPRMWLSWLQARGVA